MNKCAKFHKDSPSEKKVKSNLLSAIELSETVVFVYNFEKKPYASEQLRWLIWPTFPLNFFMKFSKKMPLYFFYTILQKSQKMTKNSNLGGPALTSNLVVNVQGKMVFLSVTQVWRILPSHRGILLQVAFRLQEARTIGSFSDEWTVFFVQ